MAPDDPLADLIDRALDATDDALVARWLAALRDGEAASSQPADAADHATEETQEATDQHHRVLQVRSRPCQS